MRPLQSGRALAGLALASLTACAFASPAAARIHRTPPLVTGSSCNLAFTDDGCGGQIQGAEFQRDPTKFADYATGYDPSPIASGANVGLTRSQALQNAISGSGAFTGKQIDFNLPGVAYPVGYNPATLVSLSTIGVGHPLPGASGCTVQSTGGGANGTAWRVYCTGNLNPATGNVASTGNLDFTNGGTTCATLEIQNATGSLTIDNFKMEYRGNCVGARGKSNAWFVNAFSPGSNFSALTLKDFVFDSNPVDCTNCLLQPLNADIIDQVQNNGHTLTLSYFAAINNTGRIINGGSGAVSGPSFNLSVDHFYVEGISLGCMTYGQHGEGVAITTYSASVNNTQKWSYGVFVIPNTQPYYPHLSQFHDRGCLTAPLYFSTGSGGAGSSWSVEEGHVLSVINMPLSGHDNASAASISISYDNYPNPTDVYVHDVWLDPKGADQCAINAGGATGLGSTSPTFNTVVNLYDANAVNGFDNGAPCAGHGVP